MSFDERFKRNGGYFPMVSALGGETELEYNEKSFLVDGYIKTNDKIFIFEYYGCYYHSCPFNCGVKCVRPEGTKNQDEQKQAVLKQLGELITIYECQWEKQRKCALGGNPAWSDNPKSQLSNFYYRTDPIREEEILNAVYNDSFEGLLVVDLDTPPELKKSFQSLNIGTIFERIVVTSEMLSEEMKKVCQSKGLKSPFNPQLSMVFSTKEYMCTSGMLKMYHSWGMKISNLQLAVEYQRGYPLKKFINKVTSKRIEATIANDTTLQNLYKLVVNSRIGF